MSNHRADLEGSLATLQKLKRQHLVGSLDAWEYVQGMRWYERVADHAKSHGLKVTVAQVATFISMIYRLVGLALDEFLVNSSTPENLRLGSLADFNPLRYTTLADPNLKDGEISFAFSVHWEGLILACLKYATQNRVWEETVMSFLAKLDAYDAEGEEWKGPKNKDQVTLIASAHTIRAFLTLECLDAYVSHVETHNPLSRFDGKRGAKSFWIYVEHNVLKSTYDKKIMSTAELKLLQSGFAKRDIALCHAICLSVEKRLAHEKAGECLQTLYEDASSHPFYSIEVHLYHWGQTYKRAVREYSLGRLEVERELVMSVILPQIGNIAPSKEVVIDLCAEARNDFSEKIERRVKRLLQFKGLSAPLSVITEAEDSLRAVQYMCLAIKKNTPWLVRVLSS